MRLVPRATTLLVVLLAVVLGMAGLVALDQRPAAACQCAPQQPPLDDEAAAADVVFVGRLVEYGQGVPSRLPAQFDVPGTMLVTTAVKGVAVGDRVPVVIAVGNGGLCGTYALRFVEPTGIMTNVQPGEPIPLRSCSTWDAGAVAALASPPPTVAPATTAPPPAPPPTGSPPPAQPVEATASFTG